jgi:GT2 family glycosyltransferase
VRPHIAAVVLNFRTPSDTVLAVKSLLASTRVVDRIVVVDNDTGENVRQALEPLPPRVTYLSTGKNLGFAGGVNVGIRDALANGADRVLLVNSDAIVPPDCLGRLERALEQHGVGIAGPALVARADPGWIASLGMSYSPRTGRMRHTGVGRRLGANDHAASGSVDAVSGCVMLIRRDVFGAIGLFHEPYFFSFEDLDFCLMAKRAGFGTFLAGDALAYHEGGRSIGADAPVRLYFGTRNHLLLAHRAGSSDTWVRSALRSAIIVLLNVAHAVRARGGSLGGRLAAVASGVRDFAAGRNGAAD